MNKNASHENFFNNANADGNLIQTSLRNFSKPFDDVQTNKLSLSAPKNISGCNESARNVRASSIDRSDSLFDTANWDLNQFPKAFLEECTIEILSPSPDSKSIDINGNREDPILIIRRNKKRKKVKSEPCIVSNGAEEWDFQNLLNGVEAVYSDEEEQQPKSKKENADEKSGITNGGTVNESVGVVNNAYRNGVNTSVGGVNNDYTDAVNTPQGRVTSSGKGVNSHGTGVKTSGGGIITSGRGVIAYVGGSNASGGGVRESRGEEKAVVNASGGGVNVSPPPIVVYNCEHCPNKYSNKGALWQHSVASHSSEKTCECKLCGRKFYRNCSLALHMKCHSDEQSCSCKICGREFNRLSLLEKHSKLHAEIIQMCKVCGARFTDQAELQKHMLNHATMYACDTCPVSFDSKRMLDLHIGMVHDGNGIANGEVTFICKVCKMKFANYTALSKHALTHATEKANVPCQYCGECFDQKSAYKKHLRLHSGVDKLRCDICKIDFTQRSSLLRHLKRLHCENGNDNGDQDTDNVQVTGNSS